MCASLMIIAHIMKKYGLGRSRSSEGKGEWTGVNLNPYVNCIHTLVGGGWKTMMVLVVEVDEEDTD